MTTLKLMIFQSNSITNMLIFNSFMCKTKRKIEITNVFNKTVFKLHETLDIRFKSLSWVFSSFFFFRRPWIGFIVKPVSHSNSSFASHHLVDNAQKYRETANANANATSNCQPQDPVWVKNIALNIKRKPTSWIRFQTSIQSLTVPSLLGTSFEIFELSVLFHFTLQPSVWMLM